jgi:hypothetical protein
MHYPLRALQLVSLYLQNTSSDAISPLPNRCNHCYYTALSLMQYRLLALELAPLYLQNSSSDAVQLLALQLASLYPQQHNLWCNKFTYLKVGITVPEKTFALMQYSYLSCSWNHCTYNNTIPEAKQLHTLRFASLYIQNTSSDIVQLFSLLLASIYLQQHYLWCSTITYLTAGITVPATTLSLMQYIYIPYSWHHITYNTSSDAVQLPTVQLASLCLQQH